MIPVISVDRAHNPHSPCNEDPSRASLVYEAQEAKERGVNVALTRIASSRSWASRSLSRRCILATLSTIPATKGDSFPGSFDMQLLLLLLERIGNDLGKPLMLQSRSRSMLPVQLGRRTRTG